MSRTARLLLPTLPVLIAAACSHTTAATPSPTAVPATVAASPALTASPDAPPPGLVVAAVPADLRYATANNFTGAPLPGYLRGDRALLRPEAARALERVQAHLLRTHVSLLVLDAYRPVRATLAMVAWAHRAHRDDLVGPYIASHSEHNRGSAVDVTLERDGRQLDMGAGFDTFGDGAHYADASGPAAANRKLLRDAMTAEGWRPYDFEWWHFSYPVPGATPLDYPIR